MPHGLQGVCGVWFIQTGYIDRRSYSMNIGYVRVSTDGQNTARQEALMNDLGVVKVFIDYNSGKDTNRPELQKALEYVRDGDTLTVESISRFARNTRDLLALVEVLDSKGVQFISKKESIDTATPAGRFMLTVFGALAQLEREYMLDRQREGINEAKKAGVYKGRTPIKKPANFDSVAGLVFSGTITAVEGMRRTDLKKSVFYQFYRKYRAVQETV